MTDGPFEFMEYPEAQDWVLFYRGSGVVFKSDNSLSKPEAEKLCELLNKAGIWEENLGRI